MSSKLGYYIPKFNFHDYLSHSFDGYFSETSFRLWLDILFIASYLDHRVLTRVFWNHSTSSLSIPSYLVSFMPWVDYDDKILLWWWCWIRELGKKIMFFSPSSTHWILYFYHWRFYSLFSLMDIYFLNSSFSWDKFSNHLSLMITDWVYSIYICSSFWLGKYWQRLFLFKFWAWSLRFLISVGKCTWLSLGGNSLPSTTDLCWLKRLGGVDGGKNPS